MLGGNWSQFAVRVKGFPKKHSCATSAASISAAELARLCSAMTGSKVERLRETLNLPIGLPTKALPSREDVARHLVEVAFAR